MVKFQTLAYTDMHKLPCELLLSYNSVAGIRAPARDYSIPGTRTSKIFATIGACANLVFAFNTGMLPEIQVSLEHIT